MNAIIRRAYRNGSLVFPACVLLNTVAIQMHAECNPSTQPPPGPSSYPPGTKVYYAFDQKAALLPVGKNQTAPQDQIKAAVKAWSDVNQEPGGNGITFAPSDSTHSATLTFSADTAYTGGRPAETQVNAGIIGPNNPATIIFHPNAKDANGDPLLVPNQLSYDTAYLSLGLHEPVHLQGIGDYDGAQDTGHPEPLPTADSSVMESFYYQNNHGAPTLLKPSSCDKKTAHDDAAATGTTADSGGGSAPPSGGDPGPVGGDPTGGGGPICDGSNDYYDPVSGTIYGYC